MKKLLLFLLATPMVAISQYNVEYSVTVKQLKANADNCDGGAPFCLNAPQDPIYNIWVTDGAGNEATNCWIFEDDNAAAYGVWTDIQNLEIAFESGVNTSYINVDMSGFETDNLNPGCDPAGIGGDDQIYSRQLVQQFDLFAIPQNTPYTTTVDLDGVYFAQLDILWTDLNAGISTLQQDLDFKLAPNPTSGEFTISFDESNVNGFEIEVIDLTGRKVYQNSVSGSVHTIDLTGEQPGIYFVNVSIDGSKAVERLIIK